MDGGDCICIAGRVEENWNIINNRVENIECSPFINIANPKIVLSMDLKK